MNHFPDWLKEALRERFDQQSFQLANDPHLKVLRKKVNMRSERIMLQADDSLKGEFLLWEEEVCYKFGQELEGAYMQGVYDGVELVFSLIYRK